MPYSKRAKYIHHPQNSPKVCMRGTVKTVKFHHAKYRGKKYKKWHKRRSGAKAIVCKSKKTKRWITQSILIPKKRK